MQPYRECHPKFQIKWLGATGIKRDSADSQKEGQDDEEDRAAQGVPGVQAARPGAAEAGEALRAVRRQEEEGADDPVLRGSLSLPLCCVLCPLNAPAPHNVRRIECGVPGHGSIRTSLLNDRRLVLFLARW